MEDRREDVQMPGNSATKEINKAAGTVLDVQCTECKRETKHEILASVDISGQDPYENTASFACSLLGE
jgi:hypothetical protein